MQEIRILSSILFGSTPGEPNQQQNGPLWHFEYPVINQEITNNAIARFQSGIVNLAEATEKNSVVDFTRSYHLRGVNYPANSEPQTVLSEIYQFVDSAAGYGQNEKEKLKLYLATRGGQNHNFLLQDLIQANHFLNNTVRGASSVCQNFNEANWTINKDGKIELNYCVDLLSIEFKHPDSPAIFTLIGDGNNELACYDLGSIEFAERRQAGLKPLMKVTAKMALEVRNDIVLPVVTMLHVDGYNDRLSVHQENFANNHDERNLAFYKLLAIIDAGIKELKDDPVIKNKLSQIKLLIEKSNFGNDMAAAKLASQYIERTACYFYKHFYNMNYDRFTMADAFKDDVEIADKFRQTFGTSIQYTITREDISSKLKKYGTAPNAAINEEIYNRTIIKKRFAKIYMQLQRVIHHYQPVASYQYSIPASGMIDADFFRKWQQTTVAPPAPAKLTMNDFRTRCNIRHHCFNEHSNEKDILEAIKDMVNENKKISDIDRDALFNWIKINRHNNSDLLAKQLVAHHEIRIKAGANQRVIPDNLRHTIKINRNSAEWEIDLDGNISLSCVYYISTIEGQRLNTFGVKNMQTNSLQFGVDAMNANHNRAPIVRIEIKTALTVNDGKVTPIVKLTKIDSYTHDVTPMRYEQDNIPLRRMARK